MPNLQDEIGKKQPFALAEEEAYLNVRRTAAVLESRFNRLFRRAGLSEATYNVLRILRAAGNDGKSWGEIRDDLVVQVPDVTRLIDRLEKKGYCQRQRSITDRRKVYVLITQTGKRLVDNLDEPTQNTLLGGLGHMSEGDLRKLSQLLERARGGESGPGAD